MPRLRHAWRATINGVRLGLLSDTDLQARDERFYARTDLYRTTDWNERGLMDWERAAVKQLFAPGGRVLVVACGGGREVLGLLEAGYDAYGCESHPHLAAVADRLLGEHGHPDRVEAAAPGEVPDGPQCDGIVLGWGVYSLVVGRAQRIAFLAGARRRLRAGGHVLLSGFGHVAPGRQLMLTARLANGLRRPRRREPIEVGDTLALNRVRVFTGEEVADEAAAAGFELTGWRLLAPADGAVRYAIGGLRAT